MIWHEIIGIILISSGLIFIVIGMYGLIRHHSLGTRLVLATKVDTVGLLSIHLGAVFYSGWNQHSFKILLIIGFTLITNPIIAHSIAHSAWSSDYDLTGGDPKSEGQENA